MGVQGVGARLARSASQNPPWHLTHAAVTPCHTMPHHATPQRGSKGVSKGQQRGVKGYCRAASGIAGRALAARNSVLISSAGPPSKVFMTTFASAIGGHQPPLSRQWRRRGGVVSSILGAVFIPPQSDSWMPPLHPSPTPQHTHCINDAVSGRCDVKGSGRAALPLHWHLHWRSRTAHRRLNTDLSLCFSTPWLPSAIVDHYNNYTNCALPGIYPSLPLFLYSHHLLLSLNLSPESV